MTAETQSVVADLPEAEAPVEETVAPVQEVELPAVEEETPPAEEPEGQVTADSAPAEMDRLDPETGVLTLTDGTQVLVQPLKLRQFLRMIRIITRGGQQMLGSGVLDLDFSSPQFATQLSVLFFFAIPEAEEETIDFVRSMVEPVGLTGLKTKEGRAADGAKKEDLFERFDNPDLEDLVDVVQVVIKREANDLQALGKRLGAMLQVAQKANQIPTP